MAAEHPIFQLRREAAADPEAFWAREAEALPWFAKWDKVFDWTPPTFRWFSGARTNLAWNCLDRHIAAGRAGNVALIGVNEMGERRSFTYAELLAEVERIAASLRAMGIGKGDRVTVYMPTMPEAIALMLAVVRIGAIHSVVFAGFGAGALGDRIRMSGSKAVFAADLTWRKGKPVDLKTIVDGALEGAPHDVEKVVVLHRTADASPMTEGRDITWADFLAGGVNGDGSHVEMEANEPAFILATSGTTAAPKLAVHVHGGLQVGLATAARTVFGLSPDDIWWSTSDIGWIVGHNYIVYSPLMTGATTIVFEASIDHPDPGTVYRIIAAEGVTGVFTSPTAVRLLMRYGEDVAREHDLSSLTRVFCAGEVLNAPAWEWLQKTVLEDRIPVVDHMWQTETAAPVFANPWGLGPLPIKPGSAGLAMPGWEAEIIDADNQPVAAGEPGILILKRPYPSLTPTIWGDPERYERDYWSKVPGVYYTGDAAMVDEDGYFWFSGRADEIIKIAGHRIGTIEVETAFLRHPAVAEAGCTGRPDDLRGEVISAFVVLRAGHEPSAALEKELYATVRKELGPVAVIADIRFVGMLPKTRSGKIMRRVFKAVVLGKDPGDVSTIEDVGSVEEAREAWEVFVKEVGELNGAGSPDKVRALLAEYGAAREHTRRLYEDLTEDQVRWRPSEHGSGIGWHLGHQAAVNHFLVRNLVAAEPSLNPGFDAVFDSATDESERGALPPLRDLIDFREAVAARTLARVEAILRGDVGAPVQLRSIAEVLLTGLANHEYQHSCWIGEVRDILGLRSPDGPPSPNVCQIDGYWVVTLSEM